MSTVEQKRRAFSELHREGCFVIPNPWSVGTARALAATGYKALATTSAGDSFALGLPDGVGVVPVDVVLERVRAIVDATALPVNADFQDGYGSTAEEVATNVRACLGLGVAGFSLEDATADPGKPLRDIEEAADRIRAARDVVDSVDKNIVLTARAECFLVGRPDIEEVTRRLSAYADAGADCLFAPGLATRSDIEAVLDTAGAKAVNVLMSRPGEFSVAQLAEMGVRRISVGSALSRVAWGAFLRAAKDIAETGTFESLSPSASFDELNELFRGE